MFKLPLSQPRMYPFYLLRDEDVSGVSGTGIVAYGVVLPSGRAVMEWNSRWQTITVFSSLDQVRRIHGHEGRTKVCLGTPDAQAAAPSVPILRWFRGYRRKGVPRPKSFPEPQEALVQPALPVVRRGAWADYQGLRALARSRRRTG